MNKEEQTQIHVDTNNMNKFSRVAIYVETKKIGKSTHIIRGGGVIIKCTDFVFSTFIYICNTDYRTTDVMESKQCLKTYSPVQKIMIFC